jgi:hypothetical protein
VLVAALAAGACPGVATSATGPTARASRPDPRQFLRVDARSRSVRLVLLAGLGGSNNGFNFDGYGRGELMVSVPRGWRVNVLCDNRGALYHSCAIVPGPMTARLAFRGASTPEPTRGLAPGTEARFSFRASRTGAFRIACLVPGHEQARMWDVLRITEGGRPSISARPGP